jgi:hypothetical protein
MASASETHTDDDGFTMDFSLDVVSDIEQDVEDVARQGVGLGNFGRARAMYEEVLKTHRDKFPVYAENLRLCLDAGDWGSLAADASERESADWSDLAANIVRLLRIVGEISKLPCGDLTSDVHIKKLIKAALDLHRQIVFMNYEDFDNEQVWRAQHLVS